MSFCTMHYTAIQHCICRIPCCRNIGWSLACCTPMHGSQEGVAWVAEGKGASVLTCMCKDVSLSSASMHSFCAGAGNSNN